MSADLQGLALRQARHVSCPERLARTSEATLLPEFFPHPDSGGGLDRRRETQLMREADFRRRYHTLKHGLGASLSSLEESMAALGEDPAEFKAFAGLIERTFVPKNLPEYEVVQRLAGAI
jgi:hypothetical protein